MPRGAILTKSQSDDRAIGSLRTPSPTMPVQTVCRGAVCIAKPGDKALKLLARRRPPAGDRPAAAVLERLGPMRSRVVNE